jgi:Ca-activated chloride channel family protein
VVGPGDLIVGFEWPAALLFGLAVPAVLGAYLLSLRRRRRQAVTYSSLALLRRALPRRMRWYRHLPAGLLLASLGVLAVAFARPQVTSAVPVGTTAIMLAMDESGSMCSTDMIPNRLGAAEKAALQFVAAQPNGVRMGLVVFSGFAELAVAPTTDHSELNNAIHNLTANDGTAIGAAILKSLDAISEVDPRVQPIGSAVLNSATQSSRGGPSAAAKPGAHGYASDIIVLLTDGSNTQGVSPLAAVPYAVARGVRIYTVGLGTTEPGPLVCNPSQLGSDSDYMGIGAYGGFGAGGGGGFGGGGYGGSSAASNPLVADLPMLREVSARTGGISYSAKSAYQLDKVLATLPRHVVIEKERRELTVLFVAAGTALAIAALGVSIRWSPYP